MTVNRIQFQTGLSLLAFLTNFGTDENVRMHWERPVDHKDSVARAAATRITICLRQEGLHCLFHPTNLLALDKR